MSNQSEKRDKIEELLSQDHTRTDTSIAREVGVTHPTVARVRREHPEWARPARPAKQAHRAAVSPRDALAIVLRAAETGELSKDDLVPVIAERWDLEENDKLQLVEGKFIRERAPRRTVRALAE